MASITGQQWYQLHRGVALAARRFLGAEAKREISASYTYQSKIDCGTSLWIYGIVENTSASLIAKPKVIAVFLDVQGQEVGTPLGYAAFAPLAGERTPILIIERGPPEFASIEYSAHARKPLGGRKASGVEVTEHLVRSSGTRGKIEISGKVKNTATVSARYVNVIMSVFDKPNVLVGLESVATVENTLAPGQESRFLFIDRNEPGFKDSKHIELHVDAHGADQ